MALGNCHDLVKLVARAFYDDQHVALFDVLIKEKFLRDDHQIHGELEQKLNLQHLQVRRLLNTLHDDCLVQQEVLTTKPPEGGTEIKRTYWFVHYRHFVNVVRYRVHAMQNLVNEMKNAHRFRESVYECPKCSEKFSESDMVQLLDEDGQSVCSRCSTPLVEKYSEKTHSDGKTNAITTEAEVLHNRLRQQIHAREGLHGGIIELLKRLDTVEIPENLPSKLLEKQREARARMDAKEKRIRAETELGKRSARPSELYNSLGQSIEISLDGEKSRKGAGAALALAQTTTSSNSVVWANESSVTHKRTAGTTLENPAPRSRPRRESPNVDERTPAAAENFDAELCRLKQLYTSVTSPPSPSYTTQSQEQEQHQVSVVVGGVKMDLDEVTSDDENKMTVEEYADYCRIREEHEED